jgi:DNA phosphorothioation-associated putative methyltransferase
MQRDERTANAKRAGKYVAGRVYAHRELQPYLCGTLLELLKAADDMLPDEAKERGNVLRIDAKYREVAYLSYPEFFEIGFPALRESWKVRLDTGHVLYRTYAESLNPPILHRKEMMLPADHPSCPVFSALTEAAENCGLFQDPHRIGLKQQWESLLHQSGVTVVGHELMPLANDLSNDGEITALHTEAIARHLTALSRSYLSMPVQSMIRHGLLVKDVSLFDYGCGKGDDVRNLKDLGYTAEGWDPHYYPDKPRIRADIVNLGFVVNVIEDLDERCAAVQQAFELADRLLVVGALIGTPPMTGVRRHGDGVITSRKTFQKYYSSSELLQFVSAVLDQDVLPAAPGLVYAFKDRALETNYLVARVSSGGRTIRAQLPDISRIKDRTNRTRAPRKELPVDVAIALAALWKQYLELGRRPDLEEISDLSALLEYFRTLGRIYRYVEAANDTVALQRSADARRNDILVAFALQLFTRRKRFRELDDRLRLDVRAFFGSYDNAQREALALLHGISDTQSLVDERDNAASKGLGYVDHEGHLQLHFSLVARLPPLLRVFAGAATAAYGDLASADLVKLHVRTGKVTLMEFDDFLGLPLPRMTQRVKVNLKEQNLEVFEYTRELPPPYVYSKSRYINEELPNYLAQLEFDEQLDALGVLGDSVYGPSPEVLANTLEQMRWTVEGFRLGRSKHIPELDERCGRYLTYRDLIECGETWARTGIDNRPMSADSYTALFDLVVNLVDPIIEYFGMIKLTYGFCSPALSKKIPARTAPRLDQHAAHETKVGGSVVCPRLGAAVDFLVEDEDMWEVTKWIVNNLHFDRLYFYGVSLPIHISYGPDMAHSVVEMRADAAGRRIPRGIKASQLGS